jgi:hypothetical protein
MCTPCRGSASRGGLSDAAASSPNVQWQSVALPLVQGYLSIKSLHGVGSTPMRKGLVRVVKDTTA